ncbi:MAG TPA: hypothetical protein VIR78_05955 [Malonomonas sp.]
MADVRFADIFFILLVCVIIFVILQLVNKGKQKAVKKDSVLKTKTTREKDEKLAEED